MADNKNHGKSLEVLETEINEGALNDKYCSVATLTQRRNTVVKKEEDLFITIMIIYLYTINYTVDF